MKLVQVIAYRRAMIKDGWKFSRNYKNESVLLASKSERDGFKVQIYSRTDRDCGVYFWGPDGLAIEPPVPYNYLSLVMGMRICGYCKRENVETERVNFAGRCCIQCLPTIRRKTEQPGWAD